MTNVDYSKIPTRTLLALHDAFKSQDDPVYFRDFFMPHHAKLPPAHWHNKTLLWLTDFTQKYQILAAPRGHAKSTLASGLLPLHSICTNRKHFILLISNTHSQAVKFLQSIKYEFETNRHLQLGYPTLKPNKLKWSDSEIELYRGKTLSHKVLALGSGHQLRGLRFLHYRPDLIIIDDGEDDEMVRSDLRRESYQEWFDNVVLKTDPEANIRVVGTVIHELALINRILRKKDEHDQHRYRKFQPKLVTALNASNQSTWPERESTKDLLLEREINPYSFSQEKQNEPVDPLYCPFKQEFFTEKRFWTQLPKNLSISITIDPAWTKKDHSKETAIVAAGWDAHERLWVLDEHHGKYDDPSLTINIILDWYQRWTKNQQHNPGHNFFSVAFDTISAQKLLVDMFKTQCRQRNLHPLIRELKSDTDKRRRIWQLEPLFRHDRIFLKPDMTYLQNQLQGFPRNVEGGLVDVIDALAYHLQLSSYRPQSEPDDTEQTPTDRPFSISFDDYAKLHEQTRGLLEEQPELIGSADSRLIASFARAGL